MSTMASQITGISIVCSTVFSGADQRKHQSSASVVFVRGIHRWPVDLPHKGPVTRKMFPFDDVIMWIVMVTTSYGHDTITIVITLLLLVITDVFIVIIILLFFLPLGSSSSSSSSSTTTTTTSSSTTSSSTSSVSSFCISSVAVDGSYVGNGVLSCIYKTTT